MNMGFDHDAWPREQMPGTEPGAVHARLDWHGLRARFAAARACRDALAGGERRSAGATGASFDRSAARALALLEEGSQSVNLDNSADGKRRFAIDDDVAVAPERGDRG
jgi:hypothetical protein